MNPSIAVLLIICVLVLYAYALGMFKLQILFVDAQLRLQKKLISSIIPHLRNFHPLEITKLITSAKLITRNHNREFEATTSAIREIWSGSCRLSCRQSEYSSFSGLSGLDRVAASNCFVTNQTQPGHSDCICETCPCKLIENVLRTCRPATNLYTQTIEIISNGYYNAVKALSDAYTYASQVSECGMSCQREGQVIKMYVLTRLCNIDETMAFNTMMKAAVIVKYTLFPIKLVGSADNINFVNNTAVKAENIKIEVDLSQKKEAEPNRKTEQVGGRDEKKELSLAEGKVSTSAQNKEFVFLKDATEEFPKNGTVSEKASVKDKDSLKYISASESSIETVSEKKSCAKCIEKGKICIGSCPRTSDSKNKDKKK